MTFKYIRSMDSTSSTTCCFNTSATDCGSFDFASACGVPLRPDDCLTVVPFMEVIKHLPSHARKRGHRILHMLVGLRRSLVSLACGRTRRFSQSRQLQRNVD